MHIQDTLRHYTRVICNHFKLILLGMLFGSTITFVVSLFLPPVYQASALVKVESVPTTATTASGNDVFSAQAQAVSYAILVTSPEVLQEAARKLPGITVDQLKKAVSDSPVDNTQLIEVRANAHSPEEAADIANTVAATFVQFQETQERTRLQNAADQLSQNMTQAKMNIDIAQRQLTILQNSHAGENSIAQQQSQLATYQSTYNALLSSNEQLQTQVQQTASMLSIAQQAIPPDKPASPQTILNTILAAGMTALLMITLVLLQDWLNMTIKTAEDVAQLAGLEPLGSIPVGTSTTAGHPRLEHTDEVKDAYSMLETPFRVLCQGKHAVLVTSPRSGSGTTTAATYLALSLAKSGMRVLIVDANLRRPSLHNILPCPDTYGPIKSLHDLASWKETSIPLPHLWLNQWKTDIPNLWLLPAGPLGQNPTSLLHEPVLGRLVDCLLSRMLDTSEPLQSRLVDMIIFDTAALDQGTDAYLLSALADATVLIVEAGKEHKDTLHRLSVAFQRFGAPILGVVVNRQQEQHQSYFYAPYQVSTERKIVVSPSPDQTALLPSSRKNSANASTMVNNEEKEQISGKLCLPLRSLVNGKDVKMFYNRKEESGYINTKGLSDSDEIKNELPETPLPLLSVHSNITASISNNQTAEAQEDAPGRPQFAPLLRFSRAMTQRGESQNTSEV
jgi:capsular exopolysaccharide synthesis family protein